MHVLMSDDGLSVQARRLVSLIRPRIQVRLEEVNRVPVSVLVWGLGIDFSSALGAVRTRLRATLR